MDQFPKPFLVAVAFAVGIVFIWFANPPYTKCQTQIEIFTKNLEGVLYAKQGKRMAVSPKISRALQACKAGNSAGGCFELFSSTKQVLREVRAFDPVCNEELAAVEPLKGALSATLGLMAQLAWGEMPPEGPERRAGWFEPPDLVLFCEMRDTYRGLYGEEAYQGFMSGVFGTFPGEAPEFQDGKCLNCDFRKPAVKVLPPDEIRRRSLFSVPCQNYR